MEQTKTCSKCGQEKTLDMFYRAAAYRLGVHSRCKECQDAYTREWMRTNRDYWNAWRHSRRQRRKEGAA